MNQYLKNVVYGKGSQRHIDFLVEIGGMNEEEAKMLNLYHQGRTELFVQEEMGLDRKSRERVEESMRAKLLLSVFECINHYMDERA